MLLYVADWPEKLISYNQNMGSMNVGNVADWPEKLISYNFYEKTNFYWQVADWPEKLISYNNGEKKMEGMMLQIDRKN